MIQSYFMRKNINVIFLFLLLLIPPTSAFSNGILTLGVGVGSLQQSEYPGSKENSGFTSFFPFVDYKSETLSISRDGLELDLIPNNYWKLVLNLTAQPPIETEKNSLRDGMDDLDAILEWGVGIQRQDEASKLNPKWRILFPLRNAIATDLSSWNSVGYRFNPKFERFYYAGIDEKTKHPTHRWNITLASLWNSESYNEYFYSVEAEDITLNRPFYSAKGGYGGSYISMSYRYQTPKWLVGTYARYHLLSESKFESSPLYENNNAFSYGFVFVFKIYKGPLDFFS